MFRDYSHNFLLLQLWYPNEPRVERLQFLLRNLQRKVTSIAHAKIKRQLYQVPECPYPDGAAEGPTLTWSVGRPGVVDQPERKLKQGNDEEAD